MTSTPPDESRSNLTDADRKSQLLRHMVLYSLVAGVASEFWSSLSPLFGMPLLVLSVIWCQANAREQARPIGRVWVLFLLLTFAISYPVYVFRTHGMAGFKVLLYSMAFFAVMLFCLNIVPLLRLWLDR